MNSLMHDYGDRRAWKLDDHEITRLCLDYRFTIEIWWHEDASPDNRVTIQIANRFVLRHRGQQIDVDPERIDTVSPALHILHRAVDSLTAYRDGRLVLRMSDGDEIVVERDAYYESWETRGTGKLADIEMLCSPHKGPPWGG